MMNVALRSGARQPTRSRLKAVDAYLAISLAGCLYALIVYPLLLTTCDFNDGACLLAPRPENRFVWPILAALSIVVVLKNRSRFFVPTHIICLLAYLAFAGLSVVWAFRPEISLVRYSQQVMVVTAVVLPALILTGKTDLLRGLFLCFAAASVLNLLYVFGPPPKAAENATPGYTGFFAGKNYLGQCATITLLLALHEMRRPGFWRAMGAVIVGVAIYLLILSNSKTAAALVVITPLVAAIAIYIRRLTGLSLATLVLVLLAGYLAFSFVTNFSVYRISYILYGESTFTGRKFIWDFAHYEISQKPILGWGYQSFWLVGSDAPSVVDAPGFVKTMPNAHNGYIDAILEMGYVGFVFLVTFIFATLHACGRLIDRDPTRGWSVLSLVIFVIIGNGLESTFMRGFEFMWVLFLILAAEIARHWQPVLAEAQVAVQVMTRRRQGMSAVPRLPPVTANDEFAPRSRIAPPKS